MKNKPGIVNIIKETYIYFPCTRIVYVRGETMHAGVDMYVCQFKKYFKLKSLQKPILLSSDLVFFSIKVIQAGKIRHIVRHLNDPHLAHGPQFRIMI